ncbi:hypothetical protein F5884DRAFT_853996 [Xylogone sp. PMI_703]|nr:hypothetical protein F5884DRAFT_853996 [Xylogone sp. PMI_703]
MALRDSFGDRRIPDITRKITACVACRKQKIKCHMNGLNPPCSRCKARGLPCTVNKSLQMILENDVGWKEGIEQRMKKLEDSCGIVVNQPDSQQNDLPASSSDAQASPSAIIESNSELEEFKSDSLPPPPENTGEVSLNLSCHLGSFPGSSIVNLAFTEYGTQPLYKPDLISAGLVSLEAAEGYFKIYHKSMDSCVGRILAEDDCLANIRARSSLLTAAICTVGSLREDLAGHKKCFDAFIKEVSSRLFSRNYSRDDVRALCIGAFWLNKVSSTLIGLAVRIATDLDLHRCITKMPHVKRECYERTRLYFLVYICDHHCSLIYGKPPMTREFRSLKNPRAFLESDLCIPADEKLVSEVELWSINSRVFDIFGADTEATIAIDRIAELDSLNRSFDLCRSTVFGAITMDEGPNDFSDQLFDLHFHCAKLYLFSHTFRGSSQKSTRSSATSHRLEKFERGGVESALAIVRSVACGYEIQRRLEMLPSYFGTMIAFASIFLIKICRRETTMLHIDKNEVAASLSRLAEVYSACSERVQPRHPLCSVSKSLKIAMNEYYQQPVINDLGVEFIPAGLDNSIFALENIGNGPSILDCLGGYTDLVPNAQDFHPNFSNLRDFN